jgi:hypothetical protein
MEKEQISNTLSKNIEVNIVIFLPMEIVIVNVVMKLKQRR